MYISLFKSEIGSKLRPRSMFQPPLFTYRYGHSFILFVIGCISAEIVGTLNFFLFIQIREIGREKVSFISNMTSKSVEVFSAITFEQSIEKCMRCIFAIVQIVQLWHNHIDHFLLLCQAIPCFMYATASKDETDEKRMNPIGAEFRTQQSFKCQKHPTIPNAFFSPHSQRR